MPVPMSHPATVSKNSDGSYTVRVQHTIEGQITNVDFNNPVFGQALAEAYAAMLNGKATGEKIAEEVTSEAKNVGTEVEIDVKRIVAEAENTAKDVLANAKLEASKLTAEAEIVLAKAKTEAEELLKSAKAEAANLLKSAVTPTSKPVIVEDED